MAYGLNVSLCGLTHQHNSFEFLKMESSTCLLHAKFIFTQNMVKLIQVMLPRKDWPVGQHLSQDATH